MHLVIITLAIALSLLGQTFVKADEYANFFNSTDCTGNRTIGYNIYGPGCLVGPTWKSVYIPRIWDLNDEWCLILSTQSDCSCQADHVQFTATGFCHILPTGIQAYYFAPGPCKFIERSCCPKCDGDDDDLTLDPCPKAKVQVKDKIEPEEEDNEVQGSSVQRAWVNYFAKLFGTVV